DDAHDNPTLQSDGTWRVIAPTEPGPQAYGTGGEMVLWTSKDQGATWRKVKQLTSASKRNHGHAPKPVDAHPDFHPLWADRDACARSESSLYFTNREGDRVWRLPVRMKEDEEKPQALAVK